VGSSVCLCRDTNFQDLSRVATASVGKQISKYVPSGTHRAEGDLGPVCVGKTPDFPSISGSGVVSHGMGHSMELSDPLCAGKWDLLGSTEEWDHVEPSRVGEPKFAFLQVWWLEVQDQVSKSYFSSKVTALGLLIMTSHCILLSYLLCVYMAEGFLTY
jgi:hypothetical protein